MHRTLEMTIGRDEFLRLLPAAAGPFVAEGETVRSAGADRRWVIRLVRLADHRLGSVVVPRHRVEIDLEGCSPAEGEAFIANFRRAFLRGGG
jgi:hypothetical protein